MAYGDVTAKIREYKGKWKYSNDANYRLNPLKANKTDCSGTNHWAWGKVYGINPGIWTGDQSDYGYEIWRGTDPAKIPFDKMKPDDVIFMSSRYDDWTFAHYYSHVEVYTGLKRMIGSPNTPCPSEKEVISWIRAYMNGGKYPRIMIRRYVHYPMKHKYIKGIDISNWQPIPFKEHVQTAFNESDFVIVKASQGTSFRNSYMNKQMDAALEAGKLVGLYHYAGGGSAKAEADYFCTIAKKYIGTAILVLDWESNQNSKFGNKTWCKTFLDRVYENTGVRGFVYVSASAISQVATCAKDYGLWLAGYPDNRDSWNFPALKYKTGAWGKIPHIWQYTSSGGKIDRNVSHMTAAEWVRWAGAKLKPGKFKIRKNVNVRTGRSMSYPKKYTLKAGTTVTVDKVVTKGIRVYGRVAPFRWMCIVGADTVYSTRVGD